MKTAWQAGRLDWREYWDEIDAINPNYFREWQLFFAVEPQGEDRADLREGFMCAKLIAAWGGDIKPEDFDYLTPVQERGPSVEATKANFESEMKRMMGGVTR